MNIKKNSIFILTTLILLGSLTAYYFSKPSPRNIIAISVCSLGKNVFQSYSPTSSLTQNLYLDKLSQRSILLTNMVSYDGWRGLSRHLRQIPLKNLVEKNYQFIGTTNSSQIESISDTTLRLLRFDNKDEYFNKIQVEIENSLKRKQPFFASLHFEWAHFPFADDLDGRLNDYLSKSSWDDKEIKSRIPFLAVLFPYKILQQKFPKTFPQIKESDELAWAWKNFKDPMRLAQWKKDPSFKTDLALIKEYYLKRLKILDQELEKLLVPLEKKADIFFVSCHGQPFLENNEFLHGNPFNEETAQLPAFIHLADSHSTLKIETQTSMPKMVNALSLLINQQASTKDWEENLPKVLSEPTLLQYDCQGQQMAFRTEGKFKYIYNFASGEEQLFQIDRDKQKLILMDLAQNDSLAQKSKEEIISRAPHVINVSSKLKDEGYCFYNYSYSQQVK